MHYQLLIDNTTGDMIEAIPYCCDYCHRQGAGDDYEGWNGCQEGADYDQQCAHCGDIILGLASQEQ